SPQGDDALRSASTQLGIAVGIRKARVVKIHKDLGRENGHIGVALDKHLLKIPVRVNLAELFFVVHRPLLIWWIKAGVEGVEGFDESFAKTVLAIFLAGIPEPAVCIEYKRSVLH